LHHQIVNAEIPIKQSLAWRQACEESVCLKLPRIFFSNGCKPLRWRK